MKYENCDCDGDEGGEEDLSEAEGGEEDLSPDEMEEAKKMMPTINLTLVFLKDKMKELGKFKGMLDEDEEEDDYNG